MATQAAISSSGLRGAGIITCPSRLGFASRSNLLHCSRTTLSPLSSRPTRFLNHQPAQLKFVFVAGAADSSQASSSSITSDKTIIPDDEFSLSKVSFGVIGLAVGCSLLSYGFGAYFNILPGSEWSAIMLTYGFPLAIIGMALKGTVWNFLLLLYDWATCFSATFSATLAVQLQDYAELKPVPCITYSDAHTLRGTCATPILKQVRNDVIRFRYGDEQHLDEALKRIFQYGQGGGIPRRNAPILQMIREEVTEDGKYCLVLVFEAKGLQLSDFEKRQAKFTSFFGPGITAEIGECENSLYEVRLISDTVAQASV